MSSLVSGYGSSSSEDEDEERHIVHETKNESSDKPKSSGLHVGLNLPAPRRGGVGANISKKRKIMVDLPSASTSERPINGPSLPDQEDELPSRGGMSSFLPAPKNRKLDEDKAGEEGQSNDKNDIINTEGIPRDTKDLVRPDSGRLAVPSNAKPQDILSSTSAGVDASILDKIKNRKRKPIMPSSSFYPKKSSTSAGAKVTADVKSSTVSEREALDSKTPKISLFPMGPDLSHNTAVEDTVEEEEYSSLAAAAELVPPSEIVSPGTGEPHRNTTAEPNAINTEPLNKIAQEIGLDETGLRILRGRQRKGAKAGHTDNFTPQIIDYSVDQEYQRNEELRASGAFEQDKLPVRRIGGGRHQLSSLLANTTSQLDRLEESFARGRKNKKESGAKYGF